MRPLPRPPAATTVSNGAKAHAARSVDGLRRSIADTVTTDAAGPNAYADAVKVCFVVSDLRPSGGVDVVLQHAEALVQDHGFEVDLVASDDAAVESAARTGTAVVDPVAARDVEYDLAISTWWETMRRTRSLRARRRIAFLQSAEEYFYERHEPFERLGAALALRAADGYVAVSSWLASLVGELCPHAPVELVHNGIDKEVFDGRRRERDGGPLRVLVEGQPTVWFKGVRDALEALARVEEPIDVTLVCREPAEARDVEIDRVVGGLDPPGMAELYASTDVLVKLSQLEGLGLGPLEAFHHGVPCIATPYGGHEEYLRHGENGLLVGIGDLPGVTRAVGRLATDADLLERLRRGAGETAAGWPSVPSSTAAFARALRTFDGTADPPIEPLLLAWRAAAEQYRPARPMFGWDESDLAKAQTELARQADELARLNRLVEELELSRKEVAGLLRDRDEELAGLTDTRAYRAAVAMRSLVHKVRR